MVEDRAGREDEETSQARLTVMLLAAARITSAVVYTVCSRAFLHNESFSLVYIQHLRLSYYLYL